MARCLTMSNAPEAPLAPLEDFVARYATTRRSRKALRALHGLLARLPVEAPLEDALEALESLGRWVLEPGRGGGFQGEVKGEDVRTSRFRVLLAVAEDAPHAVGLPLGTLVARVLAESPPRALLLAGATADVPGFWSEALGRLADKLLPPPPGDLTAVLLALFAEPQATAWLERLPAELWSRWLALLTRAVPGALGPCRRALDEAVRLLAIRLAALGVADDFRARSSEPKLEASPFCALPDACERGLSDAGVQSAPAVLPQAELGGLLVSCRERLGRVFQALETSGVSVDLVFRLELMGAALLRLEQLMGLRHGPEDGRPQPSLALWAELLRLAQRSRSLGELMRTSSRQLARKIVERAGITGEHYITESRAEYAQMFVSAAGGGFLTAFTCAAKVAASGLGTPPFFEAVLLSLSYVVSFLVIAALGFTLATKQPAMTAAAIAGTLKDAEHGFEALGQLFARTVRSQLAATLGNILLVVPSAFAFDLAWQMAFGQSFMSAEKARTTLHSLHPTQSGTALYAALTGVVLWSSSLFAGWVDNWVTYRRLPEALARHRGLCRVVGRERAARFSRWLARHVSTVGGNVSLGVMLGSIPIVGRFFGAPLDVRHVTLSTGMLTLAWSALGEEALMNGQLEGAWLGIPVMLVLNLGVSFSLALAVAARAREVSWVDFRLLRALVGYALRRPWEFVFPPKDTRALHPAQTSR